MLIKYHKIFIKNYFTLMFYEESNILYILRMRVNKFQMNFISLNNFQYILMSMSSSKGKHNIRKGTK